MLKILIFSLQLAYLSTGEKVPGIFDSLLNFYLRKTEFDEREPPDVSRPLPEYDFIIIGAGSAGCVLANRLTENSAWKVLLVEAGGPEDMIMDIPLLAPLLQFTSINWDYSSEPTKNACLGLKNERCPIPRGRVMGGSSVLNFMVHTRGDKRDYDQWAAMGNDGWSWEGVEPYFLKSEDMQIDENIDMTRHSQGGYMTISRSGYTSKLAKAFLQAGDELGYKRRDYNTGNVEGFSLMQSTMRNGSRLSTSQAYLHPIRYRWNLSVVKYAMVTKILIENGKAVGIKYSRNGRKYTVMASKEVIVSAGAINTPQLLMLSGIGPKSHLKDLKIQLVKDLPVGFNLQDHPVIGYVIFTVDKATGISDDTLTDINAISKYMAWQNGELTITGGMEAVAFIDVFNAPEKQLFPNLEIQFISSSPVSAEITNACFRIKKQNANIYKERKDVDTYMMFMNVLRPQSRGRVWLAGKSPRLKPKIDLGFLNHPDDMKILVKGVEVAKNLSSTTAFQQFHSNLLDTPIPACAHHGIDTEAYWECHARHLTITNYHQCCTAKMGPVTDPTSVVDPRLKVIGVENLRVIDASIMPTIISGHLNSPTIMIAEKGADMIKQDWNVIQ